MCRLASCGITVSSFLLFVAALALAFPWFFIVNERTIANEKCQVLALRSWTFDYCRSDNCPPLYTCPSSTSSWRSNFKNLTTVYNVALGLASAATLMVIPVLVGFSIRHCSFNYRGRKTWHIVSAIFGFFLLLAAIVYFAIYHPDAYKKDVCPDSPCVDQISQPARSFWGVQFIQTEAVKVVWGPAGWIIACFGLPLYAMSCVLACLRTKDSIPFEPTPLPM